MLTAGLTDDITRLILTVEATVLFSDKNAKQVIKSQMHYACHSILFSTMIIIVITTTTTIIIIIIIIIITIMIIINS